MKIAPVLIQMQVFFFLFPCKPTLGIDEVAFLDPKLDVASHY
jgi:hypothetical protein